MMSTDDRMTPERIVSHSATVTIECAIEDYQPIAYGITRALGDRYQYVMVPETFTVHSDGSNEVRWTWKTKRPAEEQETP